MKLLDDTEVALKIARTALGICTAIWALAILLGIAKIEIGLPLLVIGGYSAIGMGLSAAVCVAIQVFGHFRNSKNSP